MIFAAVRGQFETARVQSLLRDLDEAWLDLLRYAKCEFRCGEPLELDKDGRITNEVFVCVNSLAGAREHYTAPWGAYVIAPLRRLMALNGHRDQLSLRRESDR